LIYSRNLENHILDGKMDLNIYWHWHKHTNISPIKTVHTGMALIAIEVEDALHEVVGEHGRFPLQQDMNEAIFSCKIARHV
jgi:hypothetical protein